jgi:hypothetical protein
VKALLETEYNLPMSGKENLDNLMRKVIKLSPEELKRRLEAEKRENWFKVVEQGRSVEEAFRQIWLLAGGPKNAALFAVQRKTTELYFNPEAASLASSLLGRIGAVKCPPLDLTRPHPLRGPVLVVGDQSIAEGNN